MIKIFDVSQTKKIDACSIENRKISSLDLIESAALSVYQSLLKILKPEQNIIVLAGIGDNGGDALALARMLIGAGYDLDVYLVGDEDRMSEGCRINRSHLLRLQKIHQIHLSGDIPIFTTSSIVIDGLFGSGLNRPLIGLFAAVVEAVNRSEIRVYSIDIPSGLYVGDNTENNMDLVIKADHVFSFQFPKLSLLLPQDKDCYKQMSVLDIGLCRDCIEKEPTNYYFVERSDISKMIDSRNLFSHKGTYGHAFLIVGSRGKIGAAVLAASSCLRTGVGLLTVHSPQCGVDILQISVPEAMVDVDSNFDFVSSITLADFDKYTIGAGSGIGQNMETKKMLSDLLGQYRKPMVIDADALNLIASDDLLKEKIPPYSILTPHPVEFERLIGMKCKNGYERLQSARDFAEKYNVYIVLKGAYTSIVTPDRNVYFNSTGNPGMATAGSGDVLTGVLTSLLAQKYSSLDASLLGVYLHGLAGDLAMKQQTERSLLASDIIKNIGAAYKKLQEY